VPPELSLRRHRAAEALRLEDRVLAVYAASHEQAIRDDPWLSEAKFCERLEELYAPGRDFEMVSGWLGDELIGYAFGSPRDNAAATWEAVRAAPPDIPIPDEPGPIYIFREFAVHPDHQGRGHGRRIHDELLAARPEPLAHLLVRVENDRARRAYTSWGWRDIGSQQPFPDAPVMIAMVVELRRRGDN
jgi:ribosomal protein S18 acetylase RimI-like enzyme